MWLNEDELEDHNGVDGHVSKASHHTLEDATVVSSSTSGLPGATTFTLIQKGTDSMPTAMDAESQIKTPCQIQQSAAPGSSHKALEDAAVELAALVDSSSTSGLPGATTFALIQKGADSIPTAMAPVVSSSTSGSPGATTVAVTLGDVDSKGKRESDNASKQTKQEDRGTCYIG